MRPFNLYVFRSHEKVLDKLARGVQTCGTAQATQHKETPLNLHPPSKTEPSFFDMTADEREQAIARAMRLRDETGVPSGRIGQTKLFLGDCDPALAKQVSLCVEQFHSDFPNVAAGLRTINVMDLPRGAYAATSTFGDGKFHIALNRITYGLGRRTVLEEHAAEDYRQGFHRFSRGIGNFEHELGHVVDLSLGSIGANSLTFADAHKISGYAVHGGPYEAFADAFANLREGVSNGRHVDDVVTRVCRAAATHENWWGLAA